MSVQERNFLDKAMLLAERLMEAKPKSVGTSLIDKIKTSENPEFWDVYLQLFKQTQLITDLSSIVRVPTGSFTVGQRVEILVIKINNPPFVDKILKIPFSCKLAIRAFSRDKYGKISSEEAEKLRPIFDYNYKNSSNDQIFFDRFFKNGFV